MKNYETTSWIMTELPITTKLEGASTILKPILPVPVAFQYIGLSSDKESILFKNLIEEDIGALYNGQQFIHYYKVSMKKLDILDTIFRKGINKVVWVMGKEICCNSLENHQQIDQDIVDVKFGEVIGIFLEDKSPKEIRTEYGWEILDYDCASCLALVKNSRYKAYFQDLE